MGATQGFEIRVLGPIEARRAGGTVEIPGAKPRALLTVLGLQAGSVLPAEVLGAVLWGEETPRTAHKALQTHISALRRALGEDAVITRGAGWQLGVGSTDATEFDSAALAARDAARAGAPETAVDHFNRALSAWRGAPELPATPRAQAEVTRWVEAHATVVDERTEALLACGQAAELVSALEAGVAEAPLREQRWGQLCLALYRAGRQGDALQAYQRARAVLSDELGVEPGPELRRLEAAILAHDAALDLQPGRPPAVRVPGPASAEARSALPTGTLPVPPTTLVGRRDELDQLDHLLAEHRLVVVAGPGGVGKTRLALAAAEAAADRFPGGVWLADLAPFPPRPAHHPHPEASPVVETVAAVLGTVEHPGRPLARAVYEQVGTCTLLVVLDNCERVLAAVSAFVEGLVSACPHVAVLMTSRERLGIASEQVLTVPPLSLVDPHTGGTKGSEAGTLFLDRVRAAEPEFDADPELIGDVCARCDGLPLAIELAAARCASLGIDGLLAGLDDRLRLLVGARVPTERHRSLRAVLDWSYDLLAADEQIRFRRLGVFASSFDLTAAALVGWGDAEPGADLIDVIGRLTDKHLLIHRHTPTGSRWHMLEVVRTYARHHLAANAEEHEAQAHYLRWASTTAVELERRLATGQPWRDRFELVASDLRAARAAGAEGGDSGDRLALALALASLDARSGAFTLAQASYEAAMAIARASGDAELLARAALGAAAPGMLFGVTKANRVGWLEEALAALGAAPTASRVRVMAGLATELHWSARRAQGRTMATEASRLAEQLGDDAALAHALYAYHYVTRGPDTVQEPALPDRIVALARRSGETQLELAGMAAQVVGLMEAGDLPSMEREVAALRAAADRLDHPEFQWYAAVYRLVCALIAGRYEEADELATAARAAAAHAPEFSVGLSFAEAVTDLRELDEAGLRYRAARLTELGDRFPRVLIWHCLVLLDELALGERRDVRARAQELSERLLSPELRDHHWLVGCCLLAEVAAALPDPALARELHEALRPFAGRIAVAGRVAAFRGSVSHALGLLALTVGDADQAVEDLTVAAEQHVRMRARPFHARSLTARNRAARRP